jgi:hypothetical protein
MATGTSIDDKAGVDDIRLRHVDPNTTRLHGTLETAMPVG